MLWVTDPTGACIYLNRAWYDFTGQTEETGLGLGWLKAVHPEDAVSAEAVFVEANARHVPFQLDYRLCRADGEYRWAIDAAAPRFGPGGEFLGYIGSVIDITERLRVDRAIRDAAKAARPCRFEHGVAVAHIVRPLTVAVNACAGRPPYGGDIS